MGAEGCKRQVIGWCCEACILVSLVNLGKGLPARFACHWNARLRGPGSRDSSYSTQGPENRAAVLLIGASTSDDLTVTS